MLFIKIIKRDKFRFCEELKTHINLNFTHNGDNNVMNNKFTAFFVWLLWSSENTFVKLLAAVIVILFVGVFISLWCKVLKARK